jgi:aerobic C4-dicarboxylate transport protein
LGFINDLIPANIVDSFAKGNILQVLVFAILFAFGMSALGKEGEKIARGIQYISDVLFKIVGFIMRVAPIGAFGAIGFTTGQYGIASLWSLGKLMGAFYLTCFLFITFIIGSVCLICRVSLWNIIKYFKEELLVTLGTASTEAVMPRLLNKLERLGCSKSVTGMVIPTGYSFNLDGAAIYFTMAAMFIAQATNTPLSFAQQLGLLAVLMVTSKGGAGVVGSAFVVLGATLASMHVIPVEGMALILGIDRFMNEARAITNMIGNTVATIAVAKWQGEFDHGKYTLEIGQINSKKNADNMAA